MKTVLFFLPFISSFAFAQTAVTFAVIGDYGRSVNPREGQVSQMIDTWGVDFIVTTGDNNYPDGDSSTIDDNIGQYYREYIDNYQGTYPGSDPPTNKFFPSLGNHDWHQNPPTPYLNYFTLPGAGISVGSVPSGNERYYDFIIGPVHFFAIDSDINEPDGADQTSAQAQWLQSALSASTAPWQIVYFHHAAYSSSSNHGSLSRMQWPFEEWGADAIFQGHDHTYERVHRDDNGDSVIVPYFVSGNGGTSLYAMGTPISGSQYRLGSGDGEIGGAMKVIATVDSIRFEEYTITDTSGTESWSTGGTRRDGYAIGLPSVLSLISPPNGAANQPTSLILLWNASPSATAYHLQFATDSAFTSLILDDSTLTDTSSSVGLLSSLTRYYWRARAFTAEGPGAYSAAWRFDTSIDTLAIVPGAKGWGTTTVAGSGRSTTPASTSVFKVTNLNDNGAGSLRTAINGSGPRVIIFETSGMIALTSDLIINEPYVTIAGQTAPSPGITIKGATLMIRTHDVLVQHLRIRVGDGLGPNPDTRDGMSIDANSQEVYNVVIDHFSISWAIDENLSFAHGTRNATVMNSIVSEGLHNSLHSEGSHSKGVIVARAQNIAIINNIMAHNYDRNPILGKAEDGFDVTAAVANNIMYDWGNQATVINEALEDTTAKLGSIVGNVYISGNSTTDPDPITITPHPNTQVYLDDNTNNRILPSDPWDLVEGDDGQITRVNSPPVWPNGFVAKGVTEVEDYVLANAGARPADKDAVDSRIIDDVQLATGSIIDSQDDVGGWPLLAQNTRALTLPTNPNSDDDGNGYTNLEEWLHNYAASVEPTPGAPFAPRLLSPLHGATSQATSLTLQWNTSLGASTYRFQLATDSTFMAGLVVDDLAVTDTLRVVDSLSSFTRFFWRVRAENGAGASPFSATRKFTTVIGAPTLSSPGDGATDQDTSLTLQWNSSAGATNYQLQLSPDTTFSSLAVDDSALTDTSRQIEGLSRLTKYNWRVKAKNAEDTTAYSEVFDFTTIPTLPVPPTLELPADGATDQDTSLTIQWNPSALATSYHLQLAADSNFTSLAVDDSTVTDTSRQVDSLSHLTTYYWRVRAKNAGGTSAYSETFDFSTIIAPPASPTLALPLDGSADQDTILSLQWNPSSGATSYHLLLATDSSLTSLVVDDSTITDTTRQVDSLSRLTKYYWRVRAKNAGGSSTYSAIFDFTTIPTPPVPPTLALPADGATDQDTSLTLKWSSSALATSYFLQLATDSNFTSVVVDDSALTDTSLQVDGLSRLTKYYWRVSAKNAGGGSAYTAIFDFTTIPHPPVAPTLLSPADDATDLDISLTLQWNPSLGATSYQLQVATDSVFTSPVVDDSTITDTSRQVDGLSHLTNYYWRVRAKNPGGNSAYSVIFDFTTIIAPPAVPMLTLPLDGATNQDTSLSLQWNPSAAAASYDLQLAMDSSFTSLVVEDSALTDTSRQVNGLSHLTTYYWRLRARNVEGMSAFSNIWRFTTIPSPPSSPTLVLPLNGATNQSVTPILRWNMVTGASTYRLEVATDSNFVLGIVLNDSSLVDTFRVASQLENDTKYYWRVNANNVGGFSPWSDSWSFTTIVRFPSQVTLVSPANGAMIAADTARFLWRWSQPTVSRYWFEKAVDSLFVNVDIDSTLSDTTNIVRDLLNGTHWWKVKAYNAAGWGPFSEARQFSVIMTDVDAGQELPREFVLNQNYPNPFNPSTVIAYALPHDSRVRLAIYNTLGQRVALLVDDDKVAGYHRVMFNNPGLASGVYIYRLIAGDFSATKKLVLLK